MSAAQVGGAEVGGAPVGGAYGSAAQPVTVLFFGDSFVAGLGDPTGLGWTTRLVADARTGGVDLTAYPLGVRRNTSADVLARWERETSARLPRAGRTGLVVSFGVNDALDGDDGRRRVAPEDSVVHLRALLDGAAAAGRAVLLVGPPPVTDERATERVAELDVRLRAEAAARGVPAVPLLDALRSGGPWAAEARSSDGAHPGADGYAQLADLVRPAWRSWLADLAASPV